MTSNLGGERSPNVPASEVRVPNGRRNAPGTLDRYAACVGRSGKDSFLVTLWSETDEARAPAESPWRGSVEHLPTKHRLYFSDPSELIAFLRRHSAGGEGASSVSGTGRPQT